MGNNVPPGYKQTEATVVVGSGDFSPWISLVDCLHKKAEWVILWHTKDMRLEQLVQP